MWLVSVSWADCHWRMPFPGQCHGECWSPPAPARPGEKQEASSLLHCQHIVTPGSLQVPSVVDLLIIWPSFNLTPKWAVGLKKIPAKKPCVKNNTNNTSTPEQDGGRTVSSGLSSLSATSWGQNNHNLIRYEMKSALKLKISRDNLKHGFPITAVLMTSLALSVHRILGLSDEQQKPPERGSLNIKKYGSLQRQPTAFQSSSDH